MTEAQIRAHVVATAKEWLGVIEGSSEHQAILDVYNSHTPLARGHKMVLTDSWCAAFVSAVGIKCGLTEIMPTECSCSKLIELYKARGRWKEDDNYIPAPGDLIMYDWSDSGKGDNRGRPDHVGIVCEVSNGAIKVIEGNINNSVGYRKIPIEGKYIRGFCLPDYASIAEEESAPSAKPSAEKYGKAISVTLHQLSKGNKGEEVRALQILLMGRGYDVGKAGADGDFGENTEKAVTNYQRDHDLLADGIAGKETLTALIHDEGLV